MPTSIAEFGLAIIVKSGIRTSSPALRSRASNARLKLIVPFVVATQYGTPTYSAIIRSNSSVFLNSIIHQPLFIYSKTAAASFSSNHGSICGIDFIKFENRNTKYETNSKHKIRILNLDIVSDFVLRASCFSYEHLVFNKRSVFYLYHLGIFRNMNTVSSVHENKNITNFKINGFKLLKPRLGLG